MFNSINFLHHYDSLKAKSLKCRVLPNSDIEPLLDSLSGLFKVSILGVSETDIPIYSVRVGSGSKRILIWSQIDHTQKQIIFVKSFFISV